MESQQIMKFLQVMQEKVEIGRKELLARLESDRQTERKELKEMMKRMHADQAKAETRHKDFLASMDARWNAWREKMNANHDEMVAYQELEAHPEVEKPASVDTTPEAAEERQVTEENATVMLVAELKKRRRDLRLAAERRRQKQKISTLKSCGPPKELAVARRGTSHHTTVAWRKRIIFGKSSTQRNCGPRKEVSTAGIKITRCAGHRRMDKKKDNAKQETPKRTEKNRCWKYPECNTGIRDRGPKQRLRVSNQLKDLTKNAI
jgi:hypothetical protein